MISLDRDIKREHCVKCTKEIYPYRDWLRVEERGLRGKRGKHDDDRQKFSPFSPENFPLPIKYIVFDSEHLCITERTIYSPQQFVVPTILYYFYLYFALLVMVTSSYLTTGGTPIGSWVLTSVVLQVGCGLSFLCMSQIKMHTFI